jgi:hypothetical protein
MGSPSYPAFLDTGGQGPDNLCTVCSQIPFNALPFEDQDAYPHHLTLDALEMSGKTCAVCHLLYWAAGCSLVDPGGRVSTKNIHLPSGAKASATYIESNYSQYGMHGLDNGAAMIDLSMPVADYRPPIQTDLKLTFPNSTVMKDGEAKPLRPWLFVNWYKSPFVNSEQMMMVGLGVRLGTSGKIEDAVDCSGDTVNLRGSYLRFRTDEGVMYRAYVVKTLNLTSS